MGTQEGTGHWAPGKAQDTGDQGRYRVLGTRGDTGHWGPGDTQGTGAPEGTGCLEVECSERGEALP